MGGFEAQDRVKYFPNSKNSMYFAEAVPKRILDQMDVEGLTRENVASHLQVILTPPRFCSHCL